MRIVMASPEAAPYSKTGGLADVLNALPEALKRHGHEVAVFTPLYRCAKGGGSGISDTGLRLDVPLGKGGCRGGLWRDGDFYFIDNESFFDRSELYGGGSTDYEDNAARFAFFSMAVLEALKAMGERVDILHCHDWQTALIPLYMKKRYADEDLFKDTASVFTIHNLAYQGLFPGEIMDTIGLPAELFNPGGIEFYGKVSFIKGGLVFADILTTVSKRYSREIQQNDMGCGLDGVLMERKKDLFGIGNGMDFDKWNPETDRYISSNYNAHNLEGKMKCKKEIKEIFDLPDIGDVPLVGMVSRLDPQKGFDIIESSARKLMELPIQMALLGKGAKNIQTFLEKLAKEYPQKVGLFIGYDEPLAHKIEAGSDIYLMPSRYEPCGLNHLYSLRYGTIPVVRATGGLDDTIVNYSEKRGTGNGFKFRSYSPEAMMRALKRAVNLYMTDRKGWERLRRSAMEEDHSWNRSVAGYEKAYRKAVRKVISAGSGGVMEGGK